MPEENKIKKEDPKVDIDTSGPEVDVTLPEDKTEVNQLYKTNTKKKQKSSQNQQDGELLFYHSEWMKKPREEFSWDKTR